MRLRLLPHDSIEILCMVFGFSLEKLRFRGQNDPLAVDEFNELIKFHGSKKPTRESEPSE